MPKKESKENSQYSQRSVKIDEVEKRLEKLLKRPNRKRRRKSELPFPELGSQHEKNRTLKKVQAYVSEEHAELLGICATRFERKVDAFERAIELLADDLGIDIANALSHENLDNEKN